MNTALVLVDIQNDYFSGGKWELVGMDIAAFNAGGLLTAFRERKQPIFHVQHIAKNPDAPFFVVDTYGAEIHESVKHQEKANTTVLNITHAMCISEVKIPK